MTFEKTSAKTYQYAMKQKTNRYLEKTMMHHMPIDERFYARKECLCKIYVLHYIRHRSSSLLPKAKYKNTKNEQILPKARSIHPDDVFTYLLHGAKYYLES
jgi:hypothetical protein